MSDTAVLAESGQFIQQTRLAQREKFAGQVKVKDDLKEAIGKTLLLL